MKWKKQKNKYLTFYSYCYTVNLFAFKKYFFAAILLCILGCTTINLYEHTAVIPKQQWKSTFQPSFEFNIQDTNAVYDLYIVIRHTNAYAYNNIWLDIGTKFTTSSIAHQQLNLILGNNTDGWMGTGMDDIFEERIKITPTSIKLKNGRYTFTIAHLMRIDPLPHIVNIGIRIEKVKI